MVWFTQLLLVQRDFEIFETGGVGADTEQVFYESETMRCEKIGL